MRDGRMRKEFDCNRQLEKYFRFKGPLVQTA